MRTGMRLSILILVLLAVSCVSDRSNDLGRGTLLIVGGKDKPARAVERFIDLCEGGPILVIPSASGVPLETGPEGAELFKGAGAEDVDWLFIQDKEMADADSVVEKVRQARGLFSTGGVQTRLMDRIGGTKTERAILDLYFNRRGVIGGTSAGAAVQSEVMITGDGDFTVLEKDNIVTARGLGLLKNCIVDQHFVARQRNNRLLSLVIEKQLSGIGIDESTAILYHADETFDVYGEGSVVVYHAKRMRVPEGQTKRLTAQDIRLHVLKAGQSFDMEAGRMIERAAE